MPSDIKAAISVLTLIVAAAYGYWEWAAGTPHIAWVAIGAGIFAVISMWIFPEAVAKKPSKTRDETEIPTSG